MNMNKRTKSPVSVDKVQFSAYTYDEVDNNCYLEEFHYDNRRDFLICEQSFRGIAVKIDFRNDRPGKGAHRDIQFALVDTTTRHEVEVQDLRIIIHKNVASKEVYLNFQFRATNFESCHTFRLNIFDLTSMTPLAEQYIRLYNSDEYLHPTDWYTVIDGGIRMAWQERMYRSLTTVDGAVYYVRYELMPLFGTIPPILPEVELKLYSPDMTNVDTLLMEPKCLNKADYLDRLYTIELPFVTSPKNSGIFYAELLCMGYTLAAFAFDTKAPDEPGVWMDKELEPMTERSFEETYSKDALDDDAIDDALDDCTSDND